MPGTATSRLSLLKDKTHDPLATKLVESALSPDRLVRKNSRKSVPTGRKGCQRALFSFFEALICLFGPFRHTTPQTLPWGIAVARFRMRTRL